LHVRASVSTPAEQPDPETPRPQVIVVGASAGGVEALRMLAAGLPAELPVAVLVVLHVSSTGRSVLADILDRVSPLRCTPAKDGEAIAAGRVYVAPPNCHLVLEDGHVRLTLGPRENGHRPAVDPLFRSAARAFGGRCCGVILSGTRDDGTIGLAAIKRAGGVAIVQDPQEAPYPGMPESAIANVAVDAVLPVAEIATMIAELTDGGPLQAEPRTPGPTLAGGADVAPVEPPPICPECGGSLAQEDVDGITSFRCHVGHRYAPLSLLGEQSQAVESALWSGVRVLRERAALLHRLSDDAGARGRTRSAESFRRRGDEASGHADELLGALDAVREPFE
jgi:two-component system, chemotaxis family, protein-glutamate methylesterase/glutaminase